MHYCERQSADFWAEPVNALTNLAFIAAAYCLARRLSGRERSRDLWLLSALITAISIGSFLWHTVAETWALLADELPILLFLHAYVVIFIRRCTAWRYPGLLLGLGLFITTQVLALVYFPADWLNGSLFYSPAWLTLLLMMLYLHRRHPQQAQPLYWAFGLFCLSLSLRSLDMWLCSSLSVGTHFAWHLLNALVLYQAVKALIPTTSRSPIHNTRHKE